MPVNGISGAFRLVVLGVALILSPAAPRAQTLDRIDAPAELPSAEFEGETYVDSRGCVFSRAGIGGEVSWVPRVNAQREPLCGETPSRGASVPIEAEAAPVADPGAASATATAAVPATPAVTIEAPAEAAEPPDVRQPPRQRTARAPGSGHLAQAPLRCPADAPVPRRITTVTGETVTVCTRGDGTLDGIRMPVGSSRQIVIRPSLPAATPPVETRTRVWSRDVAATLAYPSGQTVKRVVRQVVVASQKPGARTVVMETRDDVRTARHYIQIGTYGIAANAETARRNLQARGLPVATATASGGGQSSQVVFAGPFPTPDAANAALADLRRAGYRDAFLR